MRSTTPYILILAVYLAYIPVAFGQQEPPKIVQDEPVQAVSVELTTAVVDASQQLSGAIFDARSDAAANSALSKSFHGAQSAVDTALAGWQTTLPDKSETPSGSVVVDEADAEAIARLEADIEGKNNVRVNEDLQQRRAELMAFVEHLQKIEVVSAVKNKLSNPIEAMRIARRNRKHIPAEGSFDLRPYVDDAKWMAAVGLLETNDCKDALKIAKPLAEKDDRPAVRYLVARIQMCAGQSKQGKKSLKKLATEPGAIGQLARRRLGVRTRGADAKRVEGEYLSQKLSRAKQRARSDVDGALKSLDELHKTMASSWDKYRVRLTQAEILEAAKRIDDAGEAYLAIYRKTRGWKINHSIEDRIERLERRHKKKFLTYGERIDRMRHLVSRGRYRDAKKVSIENAKIRRVKGREIRGWANYRKALQAEREKKRKKSNKLFAAAEKMVRDSEVRPRLYFGWARSLRRTNQDTKAIGLYRRLCKEYAKHHLCDDALYEAGRLLQFQDKHVEAQKLFATVIEKHPDSDFMADALWRSAFSSHLSGDYESSLKRLAAIQKDHANDRDESELSLGLKSQYWIAMNHLRAGRKDKARAEFQRTIEMGRLTWYGRLAVARMAEQNWKPRLDLPSGRLTKEDLEDLASLNVSKSPRLEVAAELVRLGLWEDALAELKEQTAIHPVPEGAHQMLAAVHLARGSANWAHWIMKKHIDEAGPTEATLRDWGTAFPLNYMDLSHKYATKAGVSPFLVQSIMRQESGFRPKVKSWAGAMGLMQMMPRTANWTSKTFLKGNKYRRRDLLVPEKNVELGSMFIRIHTAHSVESIPLALAGYNAGAGALRSWFKRYGDRELDAFVESITYQEARGYVRKVFTTYITYSALYSGQLPQLQLKLPKKLRKWGRVPEVDSAKPISALELHTPFQLAFFAE